MQAGFIVYPLWNKLSELKGVELSGEDLHEALTVASDKQFGYLHILAKENNITLINEITKKLYEKSRSS